MVLFHKTQLLYLRPTLALLASALLAFAMACGSDSSSTSSTQRPTSTTPPSAPAQGSPPSAGGSSTQATSVFVYVGQQNAPNGNGKIAGFKISSQGSAQATPSSPYTGSGSGLAASPAGYFVFGSDFANIESWAVGSDGALNRANNVAGVFGALLMIDNSGHTLYAQEFYIGGTGNNDYAFLSIGTNGGLQKIGATPLSVDGGRMAFTPEDRHVYQTFCYHLDASIVGYTRNSDGTLTGFKTNAVLPVEPNASVACPSSLAVSPDGKYLVATLIDVLSTTGALFGIYTINSDGTLTPVSGSPYPASSQAKDVIFDPSGQFLLAAESDGIAAYQFTPGSAPVRVSGSPAGGAALDRLMLSRSGQLLFSISSASQSLSIFTFNNGTVTLAPGSPYSLGFTPGDLTVVQH